MRCDKPLARPERYAPADRAACSPDACSCPWRRMELDQADDLTRIADARAYQQHGLLLRAGGIEDQPAVWWQAVQAVVAEDAAIQREIDAEAERRRKAEAARARR